MVGFIRRWRQKLEEDRKHYDHITELFLEVKALSIEEAKARLHDVLADTRVFKTAAADDHAPAMVLQLSPGVEDLFSTFRAIRSIDGLEISDELISPVKGREEFIQFGLTADLEAVCQMPPSEVIYYDVAESGPVDPAYASVYHWLLTDYLTSPEITES